MYAIRLADDRMLIPRIAEGEGVIGDGMEEIGPEDERWAEWEPFAVTEEELETIRETGEEPNAIS